ncbi:MAG: D-alanine--D-alanine ligase [Candidatus Cloacimonetes bacterium HGW-Cloacimonetes-2]|jgi:D-alanine-D-alanine ligase|nr:MAG: D-alanine--D-alanine ligase [Candidatus Cloacimonetes bacterium HGW-Cloacimonetes-2]
MKRILVMRGGDSPEREVSLKSGAAVLQELGSMGYDIVDFDPAEYPDLSELLAGIEQHQPDLIFNALHGGSGENGELAAALELAGWKFTGSGSRASVLAMDKYVSKLIVQAEGLLVPDYVMMRYDLLEDYQDSSDYAGFVSKLGLPMVVKPVDAGSSVGISLVEKLEQLKPAVVEAFKYCDRVLVEQYIPGRELTVSVIAGKALPVVEIKPVSGWYDYENKYTKGKTEYIAPAELSPAESELLKLFAEKIWKAHSLANYARIDFRYDGNKAWFLEVNTLPGMTALSLVPMAAKAQGMSFGDLLEKIIETVNM